MSDELRQRIDELEHAICEEIDRQESKYPNNNKSHRLRAVVGIEALRNYDEQHDDLYDEPFDDLDGFDGKIVHPGPTEYPTASDVFDMEKGTVISFVIRPGQEPPFLPRDVVRIVNRDGYFSRREVLSIERWRTGCFGHEHEPYDGIWALDDPDRPDGQPPRQRWAVLVPYCKVDVGAALIIQESK